MLLLIHVTIAVTGLLATTATFIKPSNTKISFCYGLLGGTLLSGTLLVLASNTGLLRACVSGVV